MRPSITTSAPSWGCWRGGAAPPPRAGAPAPAPRPPRGSLGACLGVLAGGRLADRWARRTRLSRPLIQCAGLALGAPFVFLVGRADSSTVVFVSLGLFGLFRGLYDSNLFASLYEVIRPEVSIEEK